MLFRSRLFAARRDRRRPFGAPEAADLGARRRLFRDQSRDITPILSFSFYNHSRSSDCFASIVAQSRIRGMHEIYGLCSMRHDEKNSGIL